MCGGCAGRFHEQRIWSWAQDDLNTALLGDRDRSVLGRLGPTWFTDALGLVTGQKTVNQTTATTGASITATYESDPTAKNLLAAVVGAFGNGTTITAPSGWSEAKNEAGTATTPAQAIFYKLSAGAADTSVTATFSPVDYRHDNNLRIQRRAGDCSMGPPATRARSRLQHGYADCAVGPRPIFSSAP